MTGRFDRPIRVLQVIARLNVGGPASQIAALVRGIDPAIFDFAVAAGDTGPGEADDTALHRRSSLPLVRLAGMQPRPSLVEDARAVVSLDRYVRRYRPDLLHTHTAKAGVLGRLVARRHGIPTVHTFHGHLLRGYFGHPATRGVVAVEARLARSTDRLIAVGARVRDELLQAGIGRPDQYTVIPPGVAVPASLDQPTARLRLGLPLNAAVLAYAGRLTSIKRLDRLLRVMTVLQAEGRKLVLVVAGDGELRDDLASEVGRRGLDVRFLGWRADVGTIHSAADLAVLASDNEGMPVALIEAALCNRPAVATDVGSVPEVIQNGVTGLVVPPDVGRFALAVRSLLDSPQTRVQMGEGAARQARERFNEPAMVGAIAALYRELVGTSFGNQ